MDQASKQAKGGRARLESAGVSCGAVREVSINW